MARGSIQKRIGTSGRVSWTAIVDLPPVLDPESGQLKRKQKRITAPTKRELELELAKLVTASAQGMPDASRATVAEFLDYWLRTVGPSLRPATLRRYQDLVRLHLLPTIGPVRIAKLNAGHLQQLYANRSDAGLSSTTISHMHSVIHKALDDAVRWEFVHRNVADAAEPPRRSQPEMQVWSTEQALHFLDAAEERQDPLQPLWTLALFTGMRRGELLGLKWADMDLEAGTLSVRRTLSRGASSVLVEGRPKTTSAIRRIALPPIAVDSLRRHKEGQNAYRASIEPAWQDNDYVFANDVGRYLHPNALSYQFAKAIVGAGVPRIRFHDLRHTSATMLLAEGVHPKIVQERLGHSKIAITLDRYSHVTQDMQDQAAQAFEGIVNRRKTRVS